MKPASTHPCAALIGAALLGATIFPLTAAAAQPENTARIDALEEQVRLLTQELRGLKRELDYDRKWGDAEPMAARGATAPTAQPVSPPNAEQGARQLAIIAPQSGTPETVTKVMLGPGPKISHGDMSAEFFGRIHLDAAVFDDDVADHPDGAEFRRARLGVKGKLNKDFGYKFDLGFGNETIGFKDVYLSYHGIPHVDLLVGHSKPPMGFEEMSSSNDITFIERAGVTTSFVSAHQIGVAAHAGGQRWSLAGGIFNDDAGVTSNDDEALQFAARGTFAPVLNDNVAVHLGASAARRIPDKATDSFEFDANAENTLQTMDSVSATVNNVEHATLYGLEGGVFWGPLSAQGEYFHNRIDVTGGNGPDYDGYYAQLAWTITGEKRPYKGSNGTFGRIRPDRPFDPRKGDWGAWEIAVRHSALDLNDPALSGGFMGNDTIGLNWYLHDHGRMMFNVINVNTDNAATTPADDPTIFLWRGQADF